MLYLVSATLEDRSLRSGPHEEVRELVGRVVAPSADLLLQWQAEGKVLAGGVRAGSADLLFIVNIAAETHLAVRRLLFQLPIFGYYRWELTPLEDFKEWAGMLHG